VTAVTEPARSERPGGEILEEETPRSSRITYIHGKKREKRGERRLAKKKIQGGNGKRKVVEKSGDMILKKGKGELRSDCMS